jgi:1-acyl-sn-glycerol-3-phosphate acyltransferase
VAFAAFGLGALVVAGVMFPILLFRGGPRDVRERRAQYLVHRSFRIFVSFMTMLGLIRVSFTGLEHLRGRPAAVVVANHPTLIDVVLLIAAMPQADCVVKRAIRRNRFLRGVTTGAGYIPNSDGPELVDRCVSRLRAGRWVVLFPEGTRSPGGQLGSFRRGAAHIALTAGCDIVPVVITCDPPTLMKHQPWYDVPDRRVRLTVTVGAPIHGTRGTVRRTARDWIAEVRQFYETALAYGKG